MSKFEHIESYLDSSWSCVFPEFQKEYFKKLKQFLIEEVSLRSNLFDSYSRKKKELKSILQLNKYSMLSITALLIK